MNNGFEQYLERLKAEISPALGCTEPAAAALAAAYAARQLDSPLESVTLSVSRYIFKNAMNVGIPGTGLLGLDIAAALGALSAAPEKQLMVLTGLDDTLKQKARQMTAQKRVKIRLAGTAEKIYIEAEAAGGGGTGRAVISGKHTHLAILEKNGSSVLTQAGIPLEDAVEQTAGPLTLEGILRFASQVPVEELNFLDEAVRVNRTIAEEGLTNNYGLKVGKSLLDSAGTGLIANDIGNYAVALTAAAADARMAGCDKPVMSAAGSGNQGLTATLPIVAIGWKMNKPEEAIYRSIALSILVTVHTKQHIGRLSVLCGCSIAAAIGACCGMIYLLGGTPAQIGYGINSMVADISGVVCDGAKPGCALKIATAVNSAVRAANMALCGIGATSYDGIVSLNAEKTLSNLGTLGNEGMSETNDVILSMMLENGRARSE